jgi:hypothetical protein
VDHVQSGVWGHNGTWIFLYPNLLSVGAIMTDFNWSRYAQWENHQEWDHEPHDEQCVCSKCVNIDKNEMRRLEDYEAQRDDNRC